MQRPTTIMESPKPPAGLPPEAASLLDDLSHLSTYYQQRGLGDDDITPAELRFIVGLVRHQFVGSPETILSRRAQVMVFGGAGAGKSTTCNVVTGAAAAEVNAQAGYTRHPVALFIETAAQESWPTSIGPLERLDSSSSSNLDADRYSVRPIPESVDGEFLRTHVVWDCPDLTSKDASYYEGRVIEIAAVADVCLYVASDERYNDELPTNFLQAVIEAGKPTICILTKMSPYDVDEFVRMFREQVVHRLKESDRVDEIYAMPTPTMGKIADLWKESFPHGTHLRNSIRRLTRDVTKRRSEGRARAVRYLTNRRAAVMEPVLRDVGQWRLWVDQVKKTCNSAVARYRREFLHRGDSEDYQEARDALLAALPLRGQLSRVWHALEYLRAPYRMLKSLTSRYTDPNTAGPVVEEELLDRIRQQLFDSLAVAVASRRGKGALWDALHEALSRPEQLSIDSLYREMRDQQQRDLRTQRQDTYDEVGLRLDENPALLKVLRGSRLGLDGLALVVGGWLGYQLIGGTLAPIVVSLLALGLADDLVRILCQEYVRRDRQTLLDQQQKNVEALFSKAYENQLVQLPRELGPKMQKLSELCERLPRTLAVLSERYRAETAE